MGEPELPLGDSFYGREPETSENLRENYLAFIARLKREWRDGWQILIVIDGSRTGAGKSTLGLNLCRDLDPKFTIENITFRGAGLEPLYANLPPWSMVQLDEPRDLMANRGARDKELLRIVAAIGSVRKNGIGTILIAPKKELLDSLVMSGIAPYWIFVERRGVARVHVAWRGTTYKKSQPLVPYDQARVHKIGFRSLDRWKPFQIYLERAIKFNRSFFANEAKSSSPPGRGGSPSNQPPNLTGTDRVMKPECVCAACGARWRPRTPDGGRCPRCRSYNRAAGPGSQEGPSG